MAESFAAAVAELQRWLLLLRLVPVRRLGRSLRLLVRVEVQLGVNRRLVIAIGRRPRRSGRRLAS